MMTLKAELFLDCQCVLGEGPFWHENRLWWIDTERGQLFSSTPDGELLDRISLGKKIGTAIPVAPREVLTGLEDEIVHVSLDSGEQRTLAKLDQMPQGNRFNDGKVDPRGRFLIGTMNMDGKEGMASLYSFAKDHSLKVLKTGLSVSNGIAWSTSGTTMYLIDTPKGCVLRYDYDLETGDISGEKTALDLKGMDGMPDGMTIDGEGKLWIGFWGGWSIRCYDPAKSICEAVVSLPCANVTSCCFGGPKLDRLFITTASHGLKEDEKRAQPQAGSLFVCDPRTVGSRLPIRESV